jgi:hypothetical protein
MPERDLVDEITATLDEAERLQDHLHILIALKKLKTDFASSQYLQHPEIYVQNRALDVTSGQLIGAAVITKDGVSYHCLTLDMRKRDAEKTAGLLEKFKETVFKHSDGNTYVFDHNNSMAGIRISMEAEETKHVNLRRRA